MSEKPLKDYTLGEIREICKTVHCEGCPGNNMRGLICPLGGRPDKWRLHGFIFLTENERELLRLTGAKFVSRDLHDDIGSKKVVLWSDKPNEVHLSYFAHEYFIGQLPAELFPSIQPGTCLSVSDLLGEGEQTDG